MYSFGSCIITLPHDSLSSHSFSRCARIDSNSLLAIFYRLCSAARTSARSARSVLFPICSAEYPAETVTQSRAAYVLVVPPPLLRTIFLIFDSFMPVIAGKWSSHCASPEPSIKPTVQSSHTAGSRKASQLQPMLRARGLQFKLPWRLMALSTRVALL